MFCGNIFVFQAISFLIGEIYYAFDARRDENLPRAATKNIGFWAGAQHIIQPVGELWRINFENIKNLGHQTLRLLDQRQQNMFSVNLVMSIALDNFGSSLSGFLCPLGKAIKSHHGDFLLGVSCEKQGNLPRRHEVTKK